MLSLSLDERLAVGTLGLVVVGDPLLEAVLVENVRVVTLQLHNALFALEPLHADAAVEPLLKDQVAKRNLSELLEGPGPVDAAAVDAT